MTPINLPVRRANTFGNWRDITDPEAFIIEAWSQGFMFGALIIMAVITIANMHKGVLLHKMILLELLLAMSHGTFAFMSFHGYDWYLSATAALLYCANFTHNVVAWMKIAPFFTSPRPFFRPKTCKAVQWTFVSALLLTTPVVIFQIYNNFRFFNNISTLYERVRPYEPLYRDPFWVFSCLTLFYVISKSYDINVLKIVRTSPQFGIMVVAIFLSMVFSTMDILSCIIPSLSETDGVNPYWKFALVLKCLTDNIMLDDFRSVLQRLASMELRNINSAEGNSYPIGMLEQSRS